ncbi:MAG: hypothetical protein KDD68_13195, partial [Bdellovibrionales bacterium]|nr:hypothetical protein [Bdellovibrionales bacterium]
VVTGVLEKEGDACKVLVDEIKAFPDIMTSAKIMTLSLRPEMEDKLALLREILLKHPGESHLQLELELPDLAKSVNLESIDPRSVRPSPELLESLHTLLGTTENIELR